MAKAHRSQDVKYAMGHRAYPWIHRRLGGIPGDVAYFIFHISYILGGSPFSNEADFQGALHLTTNNKFHKQLKVKDTT